MLDLYVVKDKDKKRKKKASKKRVTIGGVKIKKKAQNKTISRNRRIGLF